MRRPSENQAVKQKEEDTPAICVLQGEADKEKSESF